MNQNTMAGAMAGGIGKGWEGAKTERVPTEVESQLNELKRMDEELVVRCKALRERLSSVVKSLARTEEPPTPRPSLVPLAEVLREHWDRLREVSLMLEDMERGVEL